MVSVGSLPTSGPQVFDLDTQNGVMHILASVRASDIDAAHKSELRDLVFLYTNGGKDQTVRLALEQKIAAYGVVAAPIKAKEVLKKEEPPQPTIGKYRTTPSFQVHVTAAPTTPVAAAPAPVFVPTPYAAKEQAPAPIPVPVSYEPAPQLAPVPDFTPEPVVLVATTAHPVDDKQYLDRIREIKAAVNEKVGNPVNLVDINNEVGREYMGAILDAMKKLNSGTSAGSAMKRLEEAYQVVLQTLENRDSQSTPAPAAQPAPFVPSSPAPAFVPEPVSVSAQTPHEPVPAPFVTSIPEPIPVPQVHYETVPEHESEQTSAYQPLSGGHKTGRMQIQDATTVEQPSAWGQTPNAPTHAVSTTPFAPLSDLPDKPLSIDDLPTSESLKSAATAGDPIFTLEVDEGLNQLLQEWSIFKKSGMFGTGPKGKEHPLFKKMGPLHIPLILAGRFEGATQEIKQSVTDYMNGWRYEQGLIYQQGETFEHYLRRVIRHILDLQKGKR